MNLPVVKHTNTLPKNPTFAISQPRKGNGLQETAAWSSLPSPARVLEGVRFSFQNTLSEKKMKQPNLKILGENNNGRREKPKESPWCFLWVVLLDTIRTCCSKYLKRPTRESSLELKNVSLPLRKKILRNISVLLAYLGKSYNIKLKQKSLLTQCFPPLKSHYFYPPFLQNLCTPQKDQLLGTAGTTINFKINSGLY